MNIKPELQVTYSEAKFKREKVNPLVYEIKFIQPKTKLVHETLPEYVNFLYIDTISTHIRMHCKTCSLSKFMKQILLAIGHMISLMYI